MEYGTNGAAGGSKVKQEDWWWVVLNEGSSGGGAGNGGEIMSLLNWCFWFWRGIRNGTVVQQLNGSALD